MSFQAFPYKFPQGPVINQSTGMHTNDQRNYQLSLFNRTGGSDGIGPQVTSGLMAQGSTQTTATLLGADWNQVDIVPSGTGVQIPTMKPGNDITVFNNGTNNLLVYPFGGGNINSGAVNAPVTVAPGARLQLQCWTVTQLRSV